MLHRRQCLACQRGVGLSRNDLGIKSRVRFDSVFNAYNRPRSYVSGAETHYDVLELPRSSTTKEIKTRFYELSRKFHPDVSPDSTKRFTQINAAYSILRDERSRRDYDRTLPSDRSSTTSHGTIRSASGLSRRRTRPVGTPPSSPYRASQPPSPSRAPGFAFGENPVAEGDVRNQHFRFDEHRERHSTFDNRYNIKLQEELSRRNAELKDNFLARFLGIGGLLFVIILMTGGISSIRAEVHTEQSEQRRREITWSEAMQSRRGAYTHSFWK